MDTKAVPTPRISVIIPTYNRRDLITEAIDSALAQTFTDYEVIVVDDGSTDDTLQQLRRYGDRIRYQFQDNRGVAAARNAGIRMARGEFVCFLDSDDLWKPEKLAVQIRFAEAHPEYGLIASEQQYFDADGKEMNHSKAAMYRIRNGMVVEHLLFGNWIPTSTVMLRRECLEAVGGFDEDVGQFGEDWLLWMKVAARYPIYFIPEPLAVYRFHSGQLTVYKREEQFRSLMACLGKMSGFPQFQRKPHLLREAEYRICISRGLHNFDTGDYELAKTKLTRAFRLRKLPVKPAYLLLRTVFARRFGKPAPH